MESPAIESAPATEVAESKSIEDFVFEGEQTEPQTEQKAPTLPPHGREAKFEMDGKEYVATEAMLKKHYGIDESEELTDKEFKTVLASYKAAMQANSKNRKASQIAKQVEDAFKKLYEDPKTTLRQLYKDNPAKLRELSESILLEELEEEMLDPREKEIRKQQKELEEYKRLIEEQEQAKQQAQMQALQEHYTQEITTQIRDVLDSSPDLPKNEKTVARIAFYLHRGAQRGYDLTAKDVLPLVREDIQNEVQSIVQGSDPSQLLALLGEDVLRKIRQEDLKRVKGSQIAQRDIPSQNYQPPKNAKSKTVSPEEFMRMAKDRIKNLK